ncbi:MAG: hypothetical protein DI601_19865 [Azospirillum brasilense]|uniref:hypothetical protein n=1 Tax=Roseomonas TaxID=125216 RepID=UPI00031C73D3|nr:MULTISPECIES: hypothetical protein [Roseomonas]ATR19576.1 hypothetical protein CTJ15_04250 [Roseomonas sp. FDAARGOS_362]MDT8296395.1 hypothetical protein [Roseomonas mucosa]MDT8351776.1 hypothetical protein [Roseomonas mucosa]PZP41852.1 MAG: hypothetical protein DI601_19865 [Azospirillum brasilense]
MQPTQLGLILIPLCLIYWQQPNKLLVIALIAAIFEGGAALLIGGFGLPTATLPALLIMGFVVMQYALGMRYPGESVVLWALLPLLAFAAYAVGSALLLPNAFEGKVIVWPQPTKDAVLYLATPLRASAGNITQTMYLLLNVAAAVTTALYVTRRDLNYQLFLKAYMVGGYLIFAISLWQFASRVAGVPFPTSFFHSNTGFAIVEQNFGSIPRISGPFAEPAALAVYMSGVAFCSLWLCVRGHRVMWPQVSLITSTLTILLSTSTTGIVTVVAGMPLTLCYAAVTGGGEGLQRTTRTLATLVVGSLLLLTPLLILKPEIIDAVDKIAEITMSKQDGESYAERTSWDLDAVQATVSTFGLGVGWGSFRSSSLIPGLLANGGVPGLFCLIWLAMNIYGLSGRAARVVPEHPGQAAIDGFRAALIGQLAAAVLSAPMIVSVGFFLQLGIVVGTAARITLRSRRTNLMPIPMAASFLR